MNRRYIENTADFFNFSFCKNHRVFYYIKIEKKIGDNQIKKSKIVKLNEIFVILNCSKKN